MYCWAKEVERRLINSEQLIKMHKKSKCVSHPALIATPPTTREGEPWTWQLSSALVWLKRGMTTWENPLLSLVTRPLGIKRPPRRHSRRTSRSPSRRQLSLTSQVAVTGEPRGTTELSARTLAHGSTKPSKNERKVIWSLIANVQTFI